MTGSHIRTSEGHAGIGNLITGSSETCIRTITPVRRTTVSFANALYSPDRVHIWRGFPRKPLFFLRRSVHREREGVADAKGPKSFSIVAISRVFVGKRTRVTSKRTESSQLVHHRASCERRQGLSENLCRLPRRHAARWYGSSARRQAILAHLCRQEGFNAVVRGAHDDADDCAWLGLSQEFDQYHGIPSAEKRCTRRQHTAQRHGGFVEGASSEVVDCIRVR
jgi:hypothetical protein